MQKTLAVQCVIVLALAVTLFRLARTLPWQNVIACATVIAILAAFFEALNAKTGFPFGPFSYTENFNNRVFHVPWPMPLLWVVILLNARRVAQIVLRNRREAKNYGIWMITLASSFAVSLDVVLEWFAGASHWWFWLDTKGIWQGAPLIHFVEWTVIAFFILTLASPWLIDKRVSTPTPSV